jgi:hypothetical protein
MTEQDTREALTALGQQAQRLRESIQAGRLHSDETRQATAAQLEAVAALAEERGEELMGTLFRLLSTMFEDMGRLERKIHMLEDETGIGIDR